jgi:hypothetical protein
MKRWMTFVWLVAGCGDDYLNPGAKTFELALVPAGELGGSGSIELYDEYHSDRGTCPERCQYTLEHPSKVFLTAVPAQGSTFVGWSGDCPMDFAEPMLRIDFFNGTSNSCTATFRGSMPVISSFTTLAKPEGIEVFHLGPNRPAGAPLLVAPGLPNGTYVAVAGGDTAGGLDLINVADGTRKTNQFVDISPAYGVTAYQGPTGPRWMVFGAQGTATAGWNATAMDFGGTGLGIAANTTQVATADFNDDGGAEKIMVSAPNSMIYVYAPDGTGSTIIDGTAFSGTAGQAVSGQFGRTVDEALIVLVDGRVFFGPVAGAAGRLTLVGSAGTSPRLMQCAGTAPRICAIADYSGDKIHVVEIDATGARITANLAVGDAPIDPAVLMNLGRARIAVTGSADNTLEVLSYDPATEALTVDVARAPVPNCVAPNHVRWLSLAGTVEALVACYGGTTIVRLPL